MKIEKTLNNKDIQTAGAVNAMKLSEESQAMIFQMFTGGLYSDPIGTVIREITSNCFDAHAEAGITEPVIVHLTESEISFKDMGLGMCPDRISGIYGTYFKSTKRSTNDQIGGFGIGGKTPLAYTESFTIETICEGTKYIYNVFEGNNVPQIQLMHSEETDEASGTTVRVPLKPNDSSRFREKAYTELSYFDNVIFSGNGFFDNDNEFQIIEKKTFLYNTKHHRSGLHVAFGKVSYPLDFEKLSYDFQKERYPSMNIALKIEIGELEGTGVTPSRESLKYTDKNIALIEQRIEEMVAEVKDMLKEQNKKEKGISCLFTRNANVLMLGDSGLTTPWSVPYTHLPEHLQDKHSWSRVFGSLYYFSKCGKKRNMDWYKTLGNVISSPEKGYFRMPDEKKSLKKDRYLKKQYGGGFYRILPNVVTEVVRRQISKMCKHYDWDGRLVVSKKQAEKEVDSVIELCKEAFEEFTQNYDKVAIPDDFVDEKKVSSSTEIALHVKSDYSFNTAKVLKTAVEKIKGTIVWGHMDDKSELEHLRLITQSVYSSAPIPNYISEYSPEKSQGIFFVYVNKKEAEFMKGLKNSIPVDQAHERLFFKKLDSIKKAVIKHNDYLNKPYVENWAERSIVHELLPEIKPLLDSVNAISNEISGKKYERFTRILNRFNIEVEDSAQSDEVKAFKAIQDKYDKHLRYLNIPVGAKIETHPELAEILGVIL